MKKMRRWVAILMIIIGAVSACACGGGNSTSENEPAGKFTLIISKDDGKEVMLEKQLSIEGEKSLMDYIKDNAEVKEQGGFISSINDVSSKKSNALTKEEQDKGILGYDWFIALDGEKASEGASKIVPKDAQRIEIYYKGWTAEDMAK